MFEIVQWKERYEVNSGGHSYRPGSTQKLRSKPLDFVRSKVHGRQIGTGMRKLQAVCGGATMEVFGIFHKLLEIAADAGRNRRGYLLNSDSLDDPATAEDIAFILNLSQEQVDYALTSLLSVGWIAVNPMKLPELTETPGDSGNSVKSPHLNNETETEPNGSEQKRRGDESAVDQVVDKRDSIFINKDDSDSDSVVQPISKQVFLLKLSEVLPVWVGSDHATFRNLATATENLGIAGAFGQALAIAKDCMSNGGKNPKAAFMYRVQKHFDIKLNAPWRSDEKKREDSKRRAKL